MALTDTRIRNAKPTAKPYKLSDGGGLYVIITPDEARYWRMDYRFAGKRRTLAIGIYPIVTLAAARTRREEARALLAKNMDPSAAKKAAKHAAKLAHENTFEAVAREWIGKQQRRLAPKRGSRRIFFLKSVRGRSRILMRLNCCKLLGKLRSVV
jgi:hypothetical protein